MLKPSTLFNQLLIPIMINGENCANVRDRGSWKGKIQPSNSSWKERNQLLSDVKMKIRAMQHGKGTMAQMKQPILNKNELYAEGFISSENRDITGRDGGKVEVSKSTVHKEPYQTHQENKPNCSVTQNILSKPVSTSTNTPVSLSGASNIRSAPLSSEQESPLKRQKIEVTSDNQEALQFSELNTVQQIRRRTFSHWLHRTSPSSAQMIDAGFFNCNVGDRVICIYCNLICQQWTPHTDDPCEVHIKLSPHCVYVKAKLLRREPGSILIVNEPSVGAASNNLDQVRCNELVHTVACHGAYSELPRRTASFAGWPGDNLPPVDDLVRAGFFYTGTKNIVTCFYCNGSLQNWGANDNPTIEHARWFPHCAYAKQLCGDDLYRKIQESKRAQQERARANEARDRAGTSTATTTSAASNGRQLLIPDEGTLSRLVAARLDLPVSQRLLNKKFKLSIIKRCWEDQLRLKLNDFVGDSDLHMACMILQKQIERIDGKKENIVIPSVRMKKLREDAERERNGMGVQEELSEVPITTDPSNNSDVEMGTVSQSAGNKPTASAVSTSQPAATSNPEETKAQTSSTAASSEKHDTTDSLANPCVLCLSEEKRLACIPCGHLAACVPCGHSLRSCPICRREIEAFVRIYI